MATAPSNALDHPLNRAIQPARRAGRAPLVASIAPCAFCPQSEEKEVPRARHPVVVSAAIPGNGNHLLAVCRQDADRWDAPGGYMERHETVDEAVRRTVWEGTGLLVRPVILTGVYQDMDRAEVALVFRCSLIGNDVDRRVDAARGRWLTADEVRLLMDDASAERLLDAVRLGPPKIRSYYGARLPSTEPRAANPPLTRGLAPGPTG